MNLLDEIAKTMHDVLSGNLGAVVSDVGQTVQNVAGGLGLIQPPSRGGAAQTTLQEAMQQAQLAQAALAGHAPTGVVPCSPAMVPPPPAVGRTAPSCCDRFRFDSGFLVDGATGAVWRYEQKSNAFEEVPVRRTKDKQALADSLIETKLAGLRSRYEQEVLGTTPPANRQKLLNVFEKEQLDPIRAAAKAIQY